MTAQILAATNSGVGEEAPKAPPPLLGVGAQPAARLDALRARLAHDEIQVERDGANLRLTPPPSAEVLAEVRELKPWVLGQVVIDAAYASVRFLPTPRVRTEATASALKDRMAAEAEIATAFAGCDVRAVEAGCRKLTAAMRRYSEEA